MNAITENAGTSRLMGYLYCGIAAITFLGGGYVQGSLWACGAGVWFVTTGQVPGAQSPTQRLMAKLFSAAFILMLLVYALMLFRNWH
jgi:hypothetical protein